MKFLLEQRLSTPLQYTWLTKLLGSDFEIIYRQGKENITADALSKVESSGGIQCHAIHTVQGNEELLQQIKQSYLQDSYLQTLCESLKDTSVKRVKGPFTYQGGILLRYGKMVIGKDVGLRQKLLEMFHNTSMGGHSGMTATYKRLSLLFYWRRMQQDVRQYINKCIVCQKCKYDSSKPAGLLQPLHIPDFPWTSISMDFIEGLPKIKKYSVICVSVDRFTKFSHFIALKHPYTASDLAKLFIESIYKLHEMPESIYSDRDAIFISSFWQELFRIQGVKLKLSTFYHPQTDGQTKVVNRCLECYLRCMILAEGKDWLSWLSLAEFWFNTNYHTSTKSTPFECLYGYIPPVQLPYISGMSEVLEVNQLLDDREAKLSLLKYNLQQAQNKMKLNADGKRKDKIFDIGHLVLLKVRPYRQHTLAEQAGHKLVPIYYGPYAVKDRIGEVAYTLALPEGSAVHPTFHVSDSYCI